MASFEQEKRLVEQLIGPRERGAILPAATARCSIGTVRKDHGVQITISSVHSVHDVRKKCGQTFRGTLDVHGDGLFKALGAKASLAQMFLPLRCTFEKASKNSVSLTLGAKKLSKVTLEKTLQDICCNDDPVFVFELRTSKDELLALLPTRASLIIRSLSSDGGEEVRQSENLPTFRRKSMARLWIRWWFCSHLFCVGIWALFFFPEAIVSNTVALWKPPVSGTMMDAMPLHPTTMEQAFHLGVLHERLMSCKDIERQSCDSQDVQTILRQAEKITGKSIPDPATHDQLSDVLSEIILFEKGAGIAARVRGLFTFVNFVWFLSILGIGVSVGPSLYHLLEPLRDWLRYVAERILFDIVIPIARRLHNWGAIEAFVFTLCFLGVVQGFRMEQEEDPATMVALTGTVLAIPSFAYSTLLWGGRLVKSTKSETLLQMVQLWLVCCWAPLAVHFSSVLFGYLSVLALFGMLGFGVSARGCCYFIGFDSNDALQRSAVTAAILLVFFLILRILLGISPHYLAPFEPPVAVMGSIVLLLSLLIVSNRYYFLRGDKFQHYNFIMMLALVFTILCGDTFQMRGMANTGKTFAALWLLRLYGEMHDYLNWNGWLLILVLSVAMWQISLYLHGHPEHIASLFTM